jgi:mycothiol synthase
VYTTDHRDALIDLAKRSLLPEDAREAEAIVDVLTRAPIGAVSWEGGRLIGAALASIGHKDSSVAHLDLLLVDPGFRRRGIARALLAEVEQALRTRGLGTIVVRGNAPEYAWPGVDVRYTAAICALEAAGFAHDRTAWNMTAPLPVPEKNMMPAKDIEVRRATEADLDSLRAMVFQQWGPAWTAEVERAVRGGGGVHAAFRASDGQPVAFAAWGGLRPSWFGPMGTLPAAGGLGLGSVLLRRCLADQAALGLDSAQIGWVGPVPFYSRAVGAYIDRVFFLFSKAL